MSQRIPHLYIAPSSIDERGVFSTEAIPKDSIIEICPVILIPEKEMDLIKQTVLYNYYFDWDEAQEIGAISLGYGSLFNHSYQPNAEYQIDYEMRSLKFYAIKDIEVGQEITINYNGNPDDQSPVWFDKK